MQQQRLFSSKQFVILLSLSIVAINSYAAQGCTVQTTSMNFGNYNVFSSNNLDSSSTITIKCTPANTSYTIALSSGINGAMNNRKMRSVNSSDFLSYQLYTDASRTVPWGDGSGNTATVTNNSINANTVYGRIPANQNGGVGAYNDTVTVTVNFN